MTSEFCPKSLSTPKLYKVLELLVVIFVSFFFFLEIKPYFFWNYGPSLFRTIVVIFIIISLIFLFMNKNISIKSVFMLSLYLFVAVLMGVYSEGVHISSVLAIFVICMVFLLNDTAKYKSYSMIVNVFIMLTFPGVVIFVLLLMGFEFKYDLISPLNVLKEELYRNYLFLVVPESDVQLSPFGVAFRFSGVFDEPGVIGTFSGIFLATRYVYDSLLRRCYFIFIGMCSMSLTFFILFIIIFAMNNPKKKIIISLFFIVFFVSISQWLQHISVLDRFVFSRVEMLLNFDSNINNREVVEFSASFDELFKQSDFMLGKGAGSAASEFPGGFSYKYFVYDHGIFSFISINMFFLFVIFSSRLGLKYKVTFFIILFLSLLQRPYYDSISIVVIILGATAVPFIQRGIDFREHEVYNAK